MAYVALVGLDVALRDIVFCSELQRQVDQHFMSQVLQREIKIDVSTKDYPKIYLRVSTETQEVRHV